MRTIMYEKTVSYSELVCLTILLKSICEWPAPGDFSQSRILKTHYSECPWPGHGAYILWKLAITKFVVMRVSVQPSLWNNSAIIIVSITCSWELAQLPVRTKVLYQDSFKIMRAPWGIASILGNCEHPGNCKHLRELRAPWELLAPQKSKNDATAQTASGKPFFL